MPNDYPLVTAVWNEEGSIAQTIASVMRQLLRPLKWVIMSGGSTDRTDDIIRSTDQVR